MVKVQTASILMTRAAVVFQNIDSLDYSRLGTVFKQCLGKLNLNNSCQLNLILLDTFESSIYLDSVLGKFYSAIRDVYLSKDSYLMPINVLFGPFSEEMLQLDWLFVPDEALIDRFSHRYSGVFDQPRLKVPFDISEGLLSDEKKYPVSALGGTFDHIHDGHKILLSIAAFLTSSRLIIGVTDQDLLLKKKYIEYLESFDRRCENVQDFLALLKPTLLVEIVPIRDVCGPTGTVPEIECLVVSRETVSGGEFVNKTRIEKGLPKLDIYVVNVLGGKEEDGWKEKLSSTDLRRMAMNSKV